MLIDSHCHLNMLSGGDTDEAIATYRASAHVAGVRGFVCVCVDMATWPRVMAIAKAFPDVVASVGVHPNHVEETEPTVADLVAKAADPKIVAIGETGLDYFRTEGDTEWQRDRFRRHIAAAKESGKPLIIHTREARVDTLRIMAEEGADAVGGVMHCFTEDWETASVAMEMGFYISFSGIVTFKTAESLRDVAKRMPSDRILVETDCPYLAPLPHRGAQNQPAFVRLVAQRVAEVRGESLEQVAAYSTANFERLFRAGLC